MTGTIKLIILIIGLAIAGMAIFAYSEKIQNSYVSYLEKNNRNPLLKSFIEKLKGEDVLMSIRISGVMFLVFSGILSLLLLRSLLRLLP